LTGSICFRTRSLTSWYSCISTSAVYQATPFKSTDVKGGLVPSWHFFVEDQQLRFLDHDPMLMRPESQR
jgi:hypothetical protein